MNKIRTKPKIKKNLYYDLIKIDLWVDVVNKEKQQETLEKLLKRVVKGWIHKKRDLDEEMTEQGKMLEYDYYHTCKRDIMKFFEGFKGFDSTRKNRKPPSSSASA